MQRGWLVCLQRYSVVTLYIYRLSLLIQVIKVAYGKAQLFEETANQQKLLRKVTELQDMGSLLQLLEQT